MTLDRRELLLGVGAAAATTARAVTATRPNILHIMTDQQQWATIMGRSGCRTPNLDKLAKSGLSFERSYTPSAVCCPARAMMLSGAYHWQNGVYNQVHSPPSVHRDMNEDVVLYSNRLKAAGIARVTSANGMLRRYEVRSISVSMRLQTPRLYRATKRGLPPIRTAFPVRNRRPE